MKDKKESVALLSVISNSGLVLLKLIVGVAIGSVSVISEAIHSGVDLVAAIIAFFAVKTANKPADEKHMYGHGKYENFSGTIEALLIFVAAGWIIYEAIKKLLNQEPMDTVGWGIGVMIFSAIVNIFISNKLFKVGRETDSIALQADAWHLKTDVYTSFGVAFGLVIFTLGKIAFPDKNLLWIDPVVAIAVALLIIKAAYDLTIQSVQGLLDNSLPNDEHSQIISIIESFNAEYKSFHGFKTRKAGADRFIEFHLVVNPNMTVLEAHNLSDEIADKINSQFTKATVLIHTDPFDDSNEHS